MRRTLLVLLVVAAVAALAAAPPPEAIQVHAKGIVWKDGPPSLPKGTKAAVIEGDPKSTGIFTMRLHVPAGAVVPPHWHPRPERATILSGEVQVGFGDTFDEKALTSFRAGDFYVNPPNAHHFVRFKKESVIQITGEGPWELHPLQ
jgi:quercetin dioxygenase-like cupin family protein